MAKNYNLVSAESDELWNDFVESSQNATVFVRSELLNSLSTKVSRKFIYNNEELRGGLCLVENSSGKNVVLHDFVIYDGLMFAQPKKNQNQAQIQSEQFYISEFVARELSNTYENIEISLHPSIVDIRPFLWYNYGESGVHYRANVRYTAYVQIEDFCNAKKLEDIDIYNRASNSRRQEIRYAQKEGVTTREEYRDNLFIGFYQKTFERQNINVDKKKLDEMAGYINALLKSKLGKMFVSYTAKGEIGSMALFGIDTKRAYYIFGANDPEFRDFHTGTAVLWDAFYSLSKTGIKEVDLEGVNSPQRGWFKLSYGAVLKPYYEISLDVN